jgi:hypothetical protein
MKLAREPTEQLLAGENLSLNKSMLSAWRLEDHWEDHWNDHYDSTLSCDDDSEKLEALFHLGLVELATTRRSSRIASPPATVCKKRVRFSTVNVREYALTLGDHPQADAYPVSLDWQHSDDVIVSVDAYRQVSPNSPGKLHMTRQERRQRLALIMGVAAIELTIQEEKRQSRERELELLSCPFGMEDDDDDDDDEDYDYCQDNDKFIDSYETDDYADEIDSCCSEISDSDDSDNSDIVLLADSASRQCISLDKTHQSPSPKRSPHSKRKGSIVVDWNNTWGNDSLVEDFEQPVNYFDTSNMKTSLAVPVL